MERSFCYRKTRQTVVFVVLGLAMVSGWLRISNAQESIVNPLLTHFPSEEIRQPTGPRSEPETDKLSRAKDPLLSPASFSDDPSRMEDFDWMTEVKFGYDEGFVVASTRQLELGIEDSPYLLRFNGWGQVRNTSLDSTGPNPDVNQFQLKRARLLLSGSAFTPDFAYFVQLDGRSSSGDDVRLLDYFLIYDLGHHVWGLEKGALGFKTGKYKMPFTLARYLSGRELEFTDRSMSSTFFDVNRSIAWGLYGQTKGRKIPWNWEVAVFNGLVTGGAETGSSGSLDDNVAYSARLFAYPIGSWGDGELADFEWHDTLAVRVGAGFANSAINRSGATEFASVRVVDSGESLSTLLPGTVDQYTVNLASLDLSSKWRGCSLTLEYYLRNINAFEGAALPDMFDHGFWFQLSKFVLPEKLQLLTRWSRVVGSSGTLGISDQSAEEIAGGMVWYFRGQHSKVTFDATYLNGAPINSASLDITPGEQGWLMRSQIQFSF